jgi:hypothetical protein
LIEWNPLGGVRRRTPVSEHLATGPAGDGARADDDLDLIEEAPEELPPDDSPEATNEANLTELAVDADTSSDVELEEGRSGGAS